MRTFIVSLMLVFASGAACFGQVENYSLKLPASSTVDFPHISDLDQLDSYTVQFWMNPSLWRAGACVFSRGEGENFWGVRLGAAQTLQLVAGSNSMELTSAGLAEGRWNQITLVVGGGTAKAYINHQLVKTQLVALPIPSSSGGFRLGGNGFEGRLDEIRIWKVALNDEFFHLWRNTVNKHHPQWENLLVYYKFDQNLCDKIVDYKMKYHGVLSSAEATRELVADNPAFKYRKSVAYTDFSRWADREIDADKYLLCNDLIVLSLDVDENGNATIPFPYNEGVVNNGGYLPEYAGRKGVLELNGAGAFMNVGANALNPNDKYSFSTWIYLEEWTEGAYIFKKEKSDTEGFSIRLGDEAKKRIYIRVNGVDYSRINYMKVGEWIHLGVMAFSTVKNQVYQTTFDGVPYYAVNNNQEENSYLLSGLEETPAYVGMNLKAKFDETVICNSSRSSGEMASAMTRTPMPGPDSKVEAQTLYTFDSYWSYDNPDNVGYDSYSYKHFIALMRGHYAGHRGYLVRGGFKSFSGWESRFGDPLFQSTFADEVARVAQEFDGIDLDFEWCYSGECWENYGQVIAAIRAKFPSDKVLTVTPHYVSYQLPDKYVGLVDYFPFQIYGPSKGVFLWNSYLDALNRFTAGGRYPKEKIVMSYATTTSRGYDPTTDVVNSGIPPIGVRNGLLDEGYTPDMDSRLDVNGWRRYFTGYNQVIDRCEFVHDQDLGGIMYWDMGNDVKTSHPYSLVKAASFSLNSNVDSLVTQVAMLPTSVPQISSEKNGMRVFPNPAISDVRVSLPSGEVPVKLQLMDLGGRLVRCICHASRLNVQGLASGLYIVVAEGGNGVKYHSKLNVE